MNSPLQPAPSNWKDRVARLVSAFVDLKSFTAERKHFWHEWHAIQFTVLIERREDLLFCSNPYPISSLQL